MGATWAGRWEGGRIRVTTEGRRVWMIERSIAGARYAITLEAANERVAHAELALFLRDPVRYAAALKGTVAAVAPLVLDEQLIEQFTAWALGDGRNELYVRHVLAKYLRDWAGELGARDLRAVPTVELRQVLAGWKTARKHRVIALKALSAWLRTEAGLLTSQTDPTLDLLTVKPKKRRADEDRKSYELEDVEAVYRAIDFQAVRDLVALSFKSGAHQTEIERFAKGNGQLRAVGPWPDCPIAGTLRLAHKNGDPHTVSLDAQAFAAAQRIRAGGWRSGSWAYQHLADVAARHRLPHLLLGAARHSFFTWCRTPGLGVQKFEPPQPAISMEDVMAVTGHRSPAIPRHHYDEAQHVPHLLLLPLRLVHPDDPPLQQVVKLHAKAKR